jgi:centrin-1
MTSLGFESKNATIFQMIADMDEDGSGQLEFSEFLHLMTATPDSALSKTKMRQLFNLFDDDRTECISLDNLRRVARDLAEDISE